MHKSALTVRLVNITSLHMTQPQAFQPQHACYVKLCAESAQANPHFSFVANCDESAKEGHLLFGDRVTCFLVLCTLSD